MTLPLDINSPETIRRLCGEKKFTIGSATPWSSATIGTKYSPYPHTRPCGRNWEWRAQIACGRSGQFILFCEVNIQNNGFKAQLIYQKETRWMLTRWESHSSHPGIHVHSWCNEEAVPALSASIQAPYQIPRHEDYKRRSNVKWTRKSFWTAACHAFNIHDEEALQGELPW